VFETWTSSSFETSTSSNKGEGFDEGEGGIQGEASRKEARGLGVGGVSVCTCRDRGAIDVKVDMQCSGLGEDVANLRFELGVKDSAAEAELVLVVLNMLNSGSCIKADWSRTVSIWAG
jgi:hypothetical protein